MEVQKISGRIGIIEDDALLNQALETALRNAGYDTVCAHNGKEALAFAGNGTELILVDIGLPDGDGISLYRELQRNRNIPAIFLTASDEEQNMLAAFDLGADDYVVKPFSMKVLLKRIEAVLGRKNKEEVYSVKELVLYPARKQVFLEGREILLTAKEYQLLEYFMKNPGQVLTKENILEQIWGLDGQFVVDNTVSVTINRLRKKLGSDTKGRGYIKNVFGIGYCIGER